MTEDKINKLFTNTVSRDFFELFTDNLLGDGLSRSVYSLALNPEYVVKIEDAAYNFQNIHEWDVWNKVEHTKFASWFAPCKTISLCGTALIQAYAADIPEDYVLPTELPAFFTDIKRNNFGLIDNKLVCRDYGYTLLIEKGLTNRMRKATW